MNVEQYLKIKYSDFVHICAAFVFFKSPILFVLTSLLNKVGFSQSTGLYLYVYYGLFAAFFIGIFCVKPVSTKGLVRFAALYGIMLVYYFYGKYNQPIWFTGDASSFSGMQYLVFFPCVVATFSCIDDWERTIQVLINFARILCWATLLKLVMEYLGNGFSSDGYSMTLGYDLALSSVILLYSWFIRRRRYDLILGTLTFLFIILFGSRGALLVIVVFIFLMLFEYYYIERNDKSKIRFLMLGVLLIGLFMFFGDYVLKAINNVAHILHINSRTLEKLLLNEISDSNGRNELQEVVMSAWDNMPIWGYGLLGDRSILNGGFSHNLAVEFITTFGYVLGPVFLITLLLMSVINYSRNYQMRTLMAIVFSCSIVSLWVSGSFASSALFFAFIGLAISCVSERGRENV